MDPASFQVGENRKSGRSDSPNANPVRSKPATTASRRPQKFPVANSVVGSRPDVPKHHVATSIDKATIPSHPWTSMEERPFWTGQKPRKQWREFFRQRPNDFLKPDTSPTAVRQAPACPTKEKEDSKSASQKEERVSTEHICHELPGEGPTGGIDSGILSFGSHLDICH